MAEKYCCGLDIGSHRVKVGLIKAKDADHMELLGAFENKTHGFKDAAVSDLSELSDCIHNTVNELAKRTGVKVREVHLGIGGEMIEARVTSTVIPQNARVKQ